MKIPMEFKPTYWGRVAGVVATFAIGFIWGGWVGGRAVAGRPVDATGDAAISARAPASSKIRGE